ncbi:bifunctional Nucleolar protein 10-Enp2/WD40-repeat-containing domain superfamily/WD40-YVTN repeat-like-containing domain superfamily [Babesia duncani]|uniref:Bifunctional Nucleolar protein 10-Enp2/WD40-repeat-containing domain superfamily/WD40-YVTN repeat-like-containing domain superfamily n=1 Tax=Babesia duncani TaxID=323732 RepID=A0AAD9PHP7_9APIC|nr:bifunctional Nucleolar protein 10-Enp2/WD40-repeat-containing domain superfamily/WD40-YVTN repeat-like-containing domain superfamily [Babesia duncani]KAK2198220.1 bifunctional Nucleolar protein 10-Enp2/WD40-repeat-containing domain superfamily/WD40-YVTN repeat-like-containing domain superfamily [Babesia duncani]
MLRRFNSNGRKIYALSAGKSNPEFIKESLKNNRNLKHDAEYQHRIELIHDLEFPQCCDTVAISPDTRYVIATGVYPPQIGIYDTLELSLKHRRGIDNAVLKTCFLESDYTKLAFLCHNRVIEFHSRSERYHSIRIPKEGRDMKYLSDEASLFTVASSNEVYRLNLEKGAFVEPLKSVCSELNCLSENPILPVVSAGGDNCTLESWDLRTDQSISKLQVGESQSEEHSITACSYSSNGIKMALGTSYGCLKIFDIRKQTPLWEKQHVNKAPINCIEWLDTFKQGSSGITEANTIAWSDHKSLRINKAQDGEFLASIESLAICTKTNQLTRINNFCFYPNSGVCFLVGDQSRVGTYFIPAIGAAPSWCSYLENITEEMELPEGTHTGVTPKPRVYDDFVFVTREQLEEINGTHLLGTKLVKEYLHGFFIDAATHRKLKEKASPFDYEEYQQQKLQEKLQAKKQMRLPIRQKPVKVNQEFAEKLQAVADVDDEAELSKKQRKRAQLAKAVLTDNRFARLFTDENFAIEHVRLDDDDDDDDNKDKHKRRNRYKR